MKLSIITINYNNRDDLQKTIESVVNQTWQQFEYIIIDGASTDGSVEVIKQYGQHIDYWVSEKDKGLYNAMNKGVEAARGEYLLMLNSGDSLADAAVLEEVFVKHSSNADLLYGNVYRSLAGVIKGQSIFPPRINMEFFFKDMISHQAVFIKRVLHEVAGKYDEQLRFSSDRKFLLLAMRHGAATQHIPIFMAVASTDGLSCQPYNFRAIHNETLAIMKEHFPEYKQAYKEIKKSRMGLPETLYFRLKLKAGKMLKKYKPQNI